MTSPPEPSLRPLAPDGRRIVDELPAAVAVTATERNFVFEHLASLIDELFNPAAEE